MVQRKSTGERNQRKLHTVKKSETESTGTVKMSMINLQGVKPIQTIKDYLATSKT